MQAVYFPADTIRKQAQAKTWTQRTDSTYMSVRGIRVGAGIQQQPHAVRATELGGPSQRRPSVLQRAHVFQCAAAAPQCIARACTRMHAS